MLFNTAQFAVFFLVVLIGHLLLRGKWRDGWLLLASMVFYALWIPAYLLLFLGVMAVNYVLAMAIVRGPSAKPALITSITLTLGLLAYFKYRNFFLENLAWAMGLSFPAGEIFLPLGISFYSFVIIALNVDIYRGHMTLPSLPRYMLFVMFFPHLIAGPILRGYEFLPLLANGAVYTQERVRRGLWLIASGLFKKVVMGDFLLAPFVNEVFANPGVSSAPDHLAAAYSMSFQIYCDFSGYSDMARGLACLLGYELPLNFAEPYLSRNPGEFWRRWHMTLSRWLRDYLYIPLGGNRGGEVRTAVNMLITMLLGGLWHGASWNFLIWGGLHGVLLGIHRFVSRTRGEEPVRFDLSNVVRIVLMFHAATLLWIFFRAPDFGTAMTMLGTLFSTSWQGEWPVLQLAIVAFCYATHVLERLVVDRSDRIVEGTRSSWSMAAAEGVAFGAVL
ncbi:MAG TPA: MBOAT family O-acyltransferase, partial [Candidatus Binatia bacterium]|nr:MBOAT family O-acyltransferase [Candidatus Binatia bacterium]